MNDYIPFLLISFFVVSNTVAFYNIYKSRLRYLQPSKGYLFSLLLVVVFVAFDYSVYSFATTATASNQSNENYARFYVENTLNKLADSEILEEDKDVLVEDLMQMFSAENNLVYVQKPGNFKSVSNPKGLSTLAIDDYLHQLRFSKYKNIIKVKTLTTDKLGKIDFIQVSM